MSGFVLSLDVVDTFHSQAIIAIAEWGVRSIICLRHAAPTGKLCMPCAAGVGAQQPDDKTVWGGQGPNLGG